MSSPPNAIRNAGQSPEYNAGPEVTPEARTLFMTVRYRTGVIYAVAFAPAIRATTWDAKEQ